jgi:tetratricopeptide (TPR) repeat protein
MSDFPTFQDLLADFSSEVFVGRGDQLALFEKALTSPLPSFLILAISGQGGIGKTTLLEQYRRIADSHKVLSALTNEDQSNIVLTLASFVTQFEDAGYPFDAFSERYHKYRELKQLVEADPKAPKGFLDMAVRSATRIGLRALRRVPIAGDAADVLLTPENEEKLIDETSALASYVAQKFTNKDEQVLLLETDRVLTQNFLNDLNKYAQKHRFVLFLDTYEKTSSYLDSWLQDMLNGKFGKFSSRVLFVIAGRYPLGQFWTRFRKAIFQVELHKFTETEAREYLARADIIEEVQIRQLLELSDQLPVLLAFLTSTPGDAPAEVSGTAVERFLQGATTEQQRIALIASLPRFFNQDILAVVLGSDEISLSFDWLTKTHFVRPTTEGWIYHEVVRVLMLRHFRLRSTQEYAEMHGKLANYYHTQTETLLSSKYKQRRDDIWYKYEIERLYHHLSQVLSKGLEEVCNSLLESFLHDIGVVGKEANIEILLRGSVVALTQVFDETKDPIIGVWVRKLEQFVPQSPSERIEVDHSLLALLGSFDGWDTARRSTCFLFSGSLAYRHAQFEKALDSFTKAIELNLKESLNYHWRGRTYLEINRHSAALEDFNKAIELKPDDADNYGWRGRTSSKMGNYLGALNDFTKAIELQPENQNNYFWRATTYWDMEDYTSALSDFTKVIKLQPENSISYYARGLFYSRTGDFTLAIEDLSQAIRLDVENSDYYHERGYTYMACEMYFQALNDLNEAIKRRPDYDDDYRLRGFAYIGLKNYYAALIDFNKAVELNAHNGNTYYGRGKAYQETKQYAESLADLTKAIELDSLAIYYYERARSYVGIHEYTFAIADFAKAIELDPENGHYYDQRGRAYLWLRANHAALDDLDKACKLLPDEANPYHWRGMAHLALHNYSDAIADYTKAAELQPGSSAPYFARGSAYREVQKYTNALADFTKAIELEPYPNWYNQRGQTYFDMKDFQAALADFTKAIELEPDNAEHYEWRGSAYREIKDYPLAIADFTTAITMEPENSDYYLRRGLAYIDVQEDNVALHDFAKAIELQPNNPYLYACRGRTSLKLHQITDAQLDFTRVLSLSDASGISTYTIAGGYAEISQVAEACAWLRKAIELNSKLVSQSLSDISFAPIHETIEFKTLMADFGSDIDTFVD